MIQEFVQGVAKSGVEPVGFACAREAMNAAVGTPAGTNGHVAPTPGDLCAIDNRFL